LEPDSQGRILVSQRLRTYAQIDADVVVAGMNKFIELWTPSLWEQKVLAPMDSGDFNSDFFTTLSI
jgi:MraZ protein